MFWKKKEKLKEISRLGLVVRDLADYLLLNGSDGGFRELASDKARSLSINDISELETMFHEPPTESPNYSFEKHGLGGWLSSCQFAIFELIYNFGEDALPFIRKLAWGEYDWTQGNAIELLIRFAADGIRRDEIILELKKDYPEIRYEAQLYAIQPLIPLLKRNPEIMAIFDELMELEDFKDAYEELTDENV